MRFLVSLILLCLPFRVGSLAHRWDDPDRVRVLVEDDELPVLLLLHDEPVLRREARLSEPDLLLPGWLLAASQRDRLLWSFLLVGGVLCLICLNF